MYDPHIQDIRGQLYAQTGASVGDSIAKGIQQYTQNQSLIGTQIGKVSQFLSRNPDVAKSLDAAAAPGAPDGSNAAGVPMTPELAAAVKRFHSGSPSLKDAAILGSFVDTAAEQQTRQSAIAAQTAQADEARRRAGLLNLQMRGLQNQFYTPPSSFMPQGGTPAPQGAQPPAGPAPQFMPQAPSAPPPPPMLARNPTSAPPMAAPAPQMPANGQQSPSVSVGAPGQQGGRMTDQVMQDVARYSEVVGKATGLRPTPEQIQQFVTARYGALGTPMDVVNIGTTDEKGHPGELAVDKRTGRPIMIDGKPAFKPNVPVGVLDPEAQARAAQLTGRTQGAMKANDDQIAAIPTAEEQIYALDRISGILDQIKKSGGTTGALAPMKAELQQYAKYVPGLNIGDPSNMQQLETAIGPMVVGMAKGATNRMTTQEFNKFQDYTANPKFTMEANQAILKASRALHERTLNIAGMVNDLRNSEDYKTGKVTEPDIQQKVSDYMLKNPIPLPTAEPKPSVADGILNKYGVKP